MKPFIAAAFAIAILLTGCSKPTITKTVCVGKIAKAEAIATSFNESQKMLVTCERSVVVMRGYTVVPIGEKAYIVTMSTGKRYITWASSDYRYPIVDH